MKSIWAIPDIHGEAELLRDILFQLLPRESDRVIFLGDMIDRGPNSRTVVEIIKKLTEENPEKFIALYGNHEDLMVNAMNPEPTNYDDFYLWEINGGDITRRSYHGCLTTMNEHLNWIKALPLFHREDGFFFSHAPIPHAITELSYEQPYSKRILTWSYPGGFLKESVFAKTFPNGMIGVCGHVHALQADILAPRFYPHYIYADAGCGCSRQAPLVAIEVRTREVLYAWPKPRFPLS